MNNITYVGIDSGSKGALSCVNALGQIKDYFAFNKLTTQELYESMLELKNEYRPQKVVLEKVWGRAGQSSKSTFSQGKNYGVVKAVAELVFGEVVEVAAVTWQKDFYKNMEADLTSKQKAFQIAKDLWPGEKFLATTKSKVAHDGIIDASLIAMYGMINYYE